jgi:hypothetical protein
MGVIFMDDLRAVGRPFAFSPMWVVLACLCSSVLARMDLGAVLQQLRSSNGLQVRSFFSLLFSKESAIEAVDHSITNYLTRSKQKDVAS